MDTWGRPHSLTIMVFLTVLGSVMMACCTNVETYCAAQVFYYVGYYGIQFSLVVFVADTSPIRNRVLLIGIISSPPLISTWAYGPTADSVLQTVGMRWGFGVWCIIIPLTCAPMLLLMFEFDRRARKAELLKTRKSGYSWVKSIWCHLRDFDVIGLLILAIGLSLLLLSLSIYSYQKQGWSSPMIISFLVIGPLFIIGFVFYEAYLSSSAFLPMNLMKDRTVVWTNIMAATLYTAEFVNSAYLYSMFIVVFNQSITQATYIQSIYYVGSSFVNLVLGYALLHYGRIKIWAFAFGIPCFIIGQGAMIAFEPSFTPIGLMVACKILISFGGGTMYPIEQLTLMAVSQEHTPALLAVESVIVDAGKGAGSAIATAIWTSMFKNRLKKYLPIVEQSNVDHIYGSLDVQSSFPMGSAARLAVNHAYLDTQRRIFIVSTTLLGITWASVLFWKDIDVRKMKAIKH